MATEYARSGDVVDVLRHDPAIGEPRSVALVHEARLEVMRLVMPAGKRLPEHRVFGPITMHCVAGAVDVLAGGERRRLAAGQLMYLAGGVPHAVEAGEDACLLVTMVLDEAGGAPAAPQGGEPARHGERTGG